MTSLMSHGFPKNRVVWPGRNDKQAHVVKDGSEVKACWLSSPWPGRQQRGLCHASEGRHQPCFLSEEQPQGDSAERPGRIQSLTDG